MRTWKDIRTATLNLGFEKINTYEKNKQAYVEAYNWAQGLIASTVGGIHKTMSVAVNKGKKIVFDLEQMAQNYDDEYISLSETGITDMENNRVDGYRLTDNRFLALPSDFEGVALVHYLAMPQKITTATPDTTECQLPLKWINIMPYLMANRLYLDDDAAKASYYWNLYVDMRDEILKKENGPQVSVVGGVDIDGWCD